jgi:dihydrofolate reductase
MKPDSKPRISIIAAMADNRVIGRDNRLPWYLPADLQHFKTLTLGKPIVMGRRTWESLPGLLPDRPHIVITRDSGYRAEGCQLAHSLEQALTAAGRVPEVMIVGGADLYRQTLPLASRIYLTLVHTRPEGDTEFPEYDPAEWLETAREAHPGDSRNPYPYTFLTLERKERRT